MSISPRGPLLAVAAAAALAVTGCGTPAAPTGGVVDPATTAPRAAPAGAVYTVVPGDSLSAIARTQCGQADRWPSLFARNAHHDQPTGGALTDPNLLRVGWQLEIDCTELPPPPTVADAPAPSTAASGDAGAASTDAPGTLQLQTVPQVVVRLAGQAGSPPAGVAPTIDLGPTGSQTHVALAITYPPLDIVAGVDGPTYAIAHGSDVLPTFAGFGDGAPALQLVDKGGNVIDLPPPSGLALVHVDLGWPTGDYRLTARSGERQGSVALRVTDSDELDLQLQTIDEQHLELEVVGATNPLVTNWYRITERGGNTVADYWAAATLDPQHGVGRIEVRRDGAGPAAYCSPEVDDFHACRYGGYRLGPPKPK